VSSRAAGVPGLGTPRLTAAALVAQQPADDEGHDPAVPVVVGLPCGVQPHTGGEGPAVGEDGPRGRSAAGRHRLGQTTHLEPRTDKSRRTVPLPRSAIETLQAHRTRQLEDQRTAAGAWQEHGLIFTTDIGTPLEPRNVLRRFEVLAERAGLRGVTLHTLRHSAASFLLAAGTHTKVVQEHLGHSSYAITADIYSHVGPAQQREAADRLDQALRW
jgi:hypothetical protein